ncbi:MAG: response regulator [Myxococcota bacterium]
MSYRALVVDDSLTVRMDLADTLRSAGFEPLLAATLAEARALLERDLPHVVVLDVRLPDGDGVELLREIRASPRHIDTIVFLLSSEAEVHDRVRGLRSGADEYVGKPYEAGFLVARARELLRRSQANGCAQRPSVLVVDDSTTFRASLAEALDGAGYDVLEAATGEEGLRVAADRRPRAIIVDGVLPGIDGPTVIRRLRLDEALRGTPCLLLTASESPGGELRALEAGADAFVRKDDELELILARLGAILRSHPSASGTDAASGLGPCKILAVDDSPTYLHEVGDVLRREGYQVVLAPSGEQALELLSLQSVDCVLLDLVMPGIGGHETCRRIKSAPATRDIPLILLTSLDGRASMLEGLGAGADDFIAKSSDSEVLVARVRAQIRRRQFEAENRRFREELLKSELAASEARAAGQLAEARAAHVDELRRKNDELEAFSYSVSHDLRAPLRAISGFTQIILEDCSAALDETGRRHLERVRKAAERMSELIEALLELSRVGRADLARQSIDLGPIARQIVEDLRCRDPERVVEVEIGAEIRAQVDPRLVTILLENLLGNAWKFTGRVDRARIEVGARADTEPATYFVRDNGVGFDMARASKLFRPFQRLHDERDFTGTGVGLATVRRIIERHSGRIWAEAEPARGATFSFTLAAADGRGEPEAENEQR